MLSFAYKWLGEKKIHVHSLNDYTGYKLHRESDKLLVIDLWELLDHADIAVGHNADRFDLRKSNARFIAHGLAPPSPYKSIDTLKIARKHFKFDSNRLDDLGAYLGVGRKLPHTGKHLWLGCMNGDAKAWRTMRRYNAQDVALLERVYLKLRPWSSSHPNLNLYTRASACQVCQSPQIIRNGRRVLRSGYRQQFRCQSCGHQFYDGPIMRYED